MKLSEFLKENNAYDDFVNEVGDEYNYVLMMVSTQRYLKGKRVNNKLEERQGKRSNISIQLETICSKVKFKILNIYHLLCEYLKTWEK